MASEVQRITNELTFKLTPEIEKRVRLEMAPKMQQEFTSENTKTSAQLRRKIEAQLKEKLEADRLKMEEEFNDRVVAHAAKEVERVERDIARRYKVNFERERR